VKLCELCQGSIKPDEEDSAALVDHPRFEPGDGYRRAVGGSGRVSDRMVSHVRTMTA